VLQYQFEFFSRKIVFVVCETKISQKSMGRDVAFQKVLLETRRSKVLALPG
jgi:hypothetical protein